MSWDLLKFCGFEKVQFFLCVFWGRVGRHPGTIYKETHRICKIHVFQDDITKIQANESISLIHWKWLISKRSILGTLFAKPSVSIRKIAGLPGDSGNARCLQTCCMARFSTYMVAFDCMASEKKKVKHWFPEASTNHRAKNTGVNRNLQMGGESRWKPPSFSAMNGPDVNLVGYLVFCGAALWGRPTRASSQTFQEHIQRNTPEV